MSTSKYASIMPRPLSWLSTFALTVTACAGTPQPDAGIPDNRNERLETFFRSFGCPTPYYVNEYLAAADTFAIDYRLLPAISVLESTCGIHQRRNNRWGWDSARKGFVSFRAGLEYIARQLSEGRYYKNKTLEEKVHMYNPRPQYARQLDSLMRKIDAALPSIAANTRAYAGGEEFRAE